MQAPTKPVSSAIIEKIKSDSENGKKRYFCLELKIPEPKKLPRAIARSDWTSWKPSFCFDANGSINATILFSLYGSIKIKATTAKIAGNIKRTKCLSFAPPIKSIETTKSATQIVMDIFGSSIIKKATIPPSARIEIMDLKDLIFSLLFDRSDAEMTIKENFAISDGWKVMNFKFIHLVAP